MAQESEQEPGAARDPSIKLLEQRVAHLEALLGRIASTVGSSAAELQQSKETNTLENGHAIPSNLETSDRTNELNETSAQYRGSESSEGPSTIMTPDDSPTDKISKDTADHGEPKDSQTTVEPNKSRIRYIKRHWNRDDEEFQSVYDGPKREAEVGTDVKAQARAYTYTQDFSADGKTLEGSLLEFEDDRLYNIVKEAIQNTYGPTYFSIYSKTYESFKTFVQCYDEFERLSRPTSDDDEGTSQVKHDLQELMETVRTSPDLASYFKQRFSSPNTITFQYLWTLFPVGTEIVARPFSNQSQLFRVDYDPYLPAKDDHSDKWVLEAWCFDHNGREYVRAFHNLEIPRFEGHREINQLPCYPVKYHTSTDGRAGPESVRQEALAAGNKFKRFCEFEGAAKMFEYDDAAFIHGKGYANNLLSAKGSRDRRRDRQNKSDSEQGLRRIRVKGRAIVDPDAFTWNGSGQLYLGSSEPLAVYERDERLSDDRVPATPKDEWARLCPPRILGYSLDHKAMMQFKLVSAREMTDAEKKVKEPYNKDLQLKKTSKDLLLALVEQHESGDSNSGAMEDIVPDKGRSLVVLLHGPPGVGKTLTAETVAKATGKPLLVVGVGEIGIDAERAESKLQQLFDLAARWEAILLIDEADVFLETRSSDAALERNSLVSVLLRALEYFTGTIILTTNRISSLDIAVQSRIHLSIQYNDLGSTDCMNIFKMFFSKLEVEEKDRQDIKKWFEDDVLDENSQHLNGREIRNLVSKAEAVAKSKKRSVNLDCFKPVYRAQLDFRRQVQQQEARYRAANEVEYSKRK